MTIQKVASGEYHQAGGYQWRYKTSSDIPPKIKAYKYHSSKMIFQYDKLGQLINSWSSARDACRNNSKWIYKGISSAALGTVKTYKNYVWSYKALSSTQVVKKFERKPKKSHLSLRNQS